MIWLHDKDTKIHNRPTMSIEKLCHTCYNFLGDRIEETTTTPQT